MSKPIQRHEITDPLKDEGFTIRTHHGVVLADHVFTDVGGDYQGAMIAKVTVDGGTIHLEVASKYESHEVYDDDVRVVVDEHFSSLDEYRQAVDGVLGLD